MKKLITAIIAAAGEGTRMGLPYSKQFAEICGKSVIFWALRAFSDCSDIDEITVVCREEDISRVSQICSDSGFDKVKNIVRGGKTRQKSVENALLAVNPETEFLVVHDGARPLITPECISLVISAAKKHNFAAAGQPVVDTVKLTDSESFVLSTVDRSNLWRIYTPQVFRFNKYILAIKNAVKNNLDCTDDCGLIEAIGEKVYLLDTLNPNIKVTTPADLSYAEFVLKLWEQNKVALN